MCCAVIQRPSSPTSPAMAIPMSSGAGCERGMVPDSGCAPRRAARAARSPRAARPDHRHRRRPRRVGRPASDRSLLRRRPRAAGAGLRADPAPVRRRRAAAAGRPGPGDIPPAGTGAPPGLAVSDAPDELLDAVVRLLRLLDRPRDTRVLAPLVKREILWRLITGEQGMIIRQLGLADSSLTHIARAVRWIRDHYAQAFRVAPHRRHRCRSPGGLRQRVTVQPRVPPPVRRAPSQDAASRRTTTLDATPARL